MGHSEATVFKQVECQHENPDGSGYPPGVSAADIPLGARIIAVSERYISLASDRPCRDAWEPRTAFSEMDKFAGMGKLDSAVLSVLFDIISEI